MKIDWSELPHTTCHLFLTDVKVGELFRFNVHGSLFMRLDSPICTPEVKLLRLPGMTVEERDDAPYPIAERYQARIVVEKRL